MSYRAIDALTNDSLFAGRVRACITAEANTYVDDEDRPILATFARDCLRGDAMPVLAFIRAVAAAPGFITETGTDDTVDQATVTDEAILAAVTEAYPLIASLYYAEDGTKLPGGD